MTRFSCNLKVAETGPQYALTSKLDNSCELKMIIQVSMEF